MTPLDETKAFALALARTVRPDPTVESMRRNRAQIERVIRRCSVELPSQPTILPSSVRHEEFRNAKEAAKILHAVFGA